VDKRRLQEALQGGKQVESFLDWLGCQVELLVEECAAARQGNGAACVKQR
jgi:hypothetical protein